MRTLTSRASKFQSKILGLTSTSNFHTCMKLAKQNTWKQGKDSSGSTWKQGKDSSGSEIMNITTDPHHILSLFTKSYFSSCILEAIIYQID